MDPAVSPDDPIEGYRLVDPATPDGSIGPGDHALYVVPMTRREAAQRVLSEDFARRLQRAEVEVAAMTQAQREATCDWLGAMLHRPPLENPRPAWAAMRALVEALWWDISDRTPADEADPDAGNERLAPNHPWGEGAES